MKTIKDIREYFASLLNEERFVVDKTGVKTIEIIGDSFLADEDHIFGKVNKTYTQRELDWYLSMSLNVNDLEDTPKIWKDVATREGYINSNYGYLVFHPNNGFQYDFVRDELKKNPNSRRAEMIYTRPSMHTDYNRDGMSDFCCTNSVSYFIRDRRLHAHVKMRSNDIVYGYRNDYFWQKYVLNRLANDLEISIGDIYWTASSLHIYERHFYLLDHWHQTKETHVERKMYMGGW